MLRNWFSALAALVFVCGIGAGDAAAADDPDLLSFGVGYFDFNKRDDPGVDLRVEYRSDLEFLYLRPFVAVSGVTSGHAFVGAGLLLDLHLGDNFVVTPSFAPHIYFGGDSDLDLGHTVEFRSQIEFAYRFNDFSRLGVALTHYSNAHLDDKNPGTEIVEIYYSLPFEKIASF